MQLWKTLWILELIETEYSMALAAFGMFDNLFATLTTSLSAWYNEHERALLQVLARQYVFSLDMISKLLGRLSSDGLVSESAVSDIQDYDKAFGDLRHLRDSIAHIEDRGLGFNKKGEHINAPMLVLGCFLGRRFEFTGFDGKCYGVDITEETLLSARDILQNVFNAYAWG